MDKGSKSICHGQGDSKKNGNSVLIEGENKNNLVGTKIDSFTVRVTSKSDPNVKTTVKVFHPSMLLVD